MKLSNEELFKLIGEFRIAPGEDWLHSILFVAPDKVDIAKAYVYENVAAFYRVDILSSEALS